MGEGKLCFSSAGNSESEHTKNYSFCCFLGFVIEYGGTCYICSVEDSKHRVICIVEVNKLKIMEAITILEAQPVMMVGVVGYIATLHGRHALWTMGRAFGRGLDTETK